MMNVDAAYDRIGKAIRKMGYEFVREERPTDSPGDRLAFFRSPTMFVRVVWRGRPRFLTLEVEADGEWVEFARRAVGAQGLEEAAVESLIHAVRNEVDETSTDGGQP
jgi:hypothetical protein